MRIGLTEAADLLGLKPDALRQQLINGKATLPAGTRVTRRGQGKHARWHLEFWPQTLADLRKAKAMGSDAAKAGEKSPPVSQQPEADKTGQGDGKPQNSDAKGEKSDGRKRPGRWWW